MLIKRLENIVEVISEDRLDNTYSEKILMIFSDKDRAVEEEKKLKDINDPKELKDYIENTDYKVNLGREDLKLIVETAERVPPFYKMAWEKDTDRIIIIK